MFSGDNNVRNERVCFYRAWIPSSVVFMLSKEPPIPQKNRRGGFEEAMEELRDHIERLKLKFGSFNYSVPYVPYNSKKPLIRLTKKALKRKLLCQSTESGGTGQSSAEESSSTEQIPKNETLLQLLKTKPESQVAVVTVPLCGMSPAVKVENPECVKTGEEHGSEAEKSSADVVPPSRKIPRMESQANRVTAEMETSEGATGSTKTASALKERLANIKTTKRTANIKSLASETPSGSDSKTTTQSNHGDETLRVHGHIPLMDKDETGFDTLISSKSSGHVKETKAARPTHAQNMSPINSCDVADSRNECCVVEGGNLDSPEEHSKDDKSRSPFDVFKAVGKSGDRQPTTCPDPLNKMGSVVEPQEEKGSKDDQKPLEKTKSPTVGESSREDKERTVSGTCYDPECQSPTSPGRSKTGVFAKALNPQVTTLSLKHQATKVDIPKPRLPEPSLIERLTHKLTEIHKVSDDDSEGMTASAAQAEGFNPTSDQGIQKQNVPQTRLEAAEEKIDVSGVHPNEAAPSPRSLSPCSAPSHSSSSKHMEGDITKEGRLLPHGEVRKKNLTLANLVESCKAKLGIGEDDHLVSSQTNSLYF